MAKSAPIHIIVHFPKSEEGKKLLAQRMAEVHADAVMEAIKGKSCPAEQKQKVLEAVINAAKKKEKTRPMNA